MMSVSVLWQMFWRYFGRTLPFWGMFLIVLSCSTKEATETLQEIPVEEVRNELESVLTTWYPRIIDEVNGGYWTTFSHNWTPSESPNKMLVTQARGLWTASRAAGFYPEQKVYRMAADHGFKFLTETMWDQVNGGFYQNYPVDTADLTRPSHKLVYGNAFALYGLSEYAKINPSPEVLSWVKKTFDWMETAAHDATGLGYYSLIVPDSVRNTRDTALIAQLLSIGWGSPTSKDQNSSIHLLEALTTTHQVWPEKIVKERLEEMLKLVRDTMVNASGSLYLYFARDWKPVDHSDSSRAFILENQKYDHRSFGHDIETAYLLVAAAEELYGKVDPKTLQVGKRLVDHSLQYGFDENFYGIFDRGYHFENQTGITVLNRQKSWWAEAEAWHALILFSRYFPDNPVYPEAANAMWNYIKKELIDYEHGGWYNKGLDENPESRSERKAHAWKGAYHNGRALIRVLEYAM